VFLARQGVSYLQRATRTPQELISIVNLGIWLLTATSLKIEIALHKLARNC
jgi:hypothetical protein